MDHEQRTLASAAQDGALCARVMRNIAAIEQDSQFAWGPLSERLMTEIRGAFRGAAPEVWAVEGDESSVLTYAPEWKANRGVNQKDVWLELADLIEGDEAYSWPSVIVSAGQTKLCLELKVRPGLQDTVTALADKDPVVVNLTKAGFKRDGESKRIVMPIDIAAEALALGFEMNDLHEALEPVRSVVGKAIASRAPIDAFLAHVRAEAKKN